MDTEATQNEIIPFSKKETSLNPDSVESSNSWPKNELFPKRTNSGETSIGLCILLDKFYDSSSGPKNLVHRVQLKIKNSAPSNHSNESDHHEMEGSDLETNFLGSMPSFFMIPISPGHEFSTPVFASHIIHSEFYNRVAFRGPNDPKTIHVYFDFKLDCPHRDHRWIFSYSNRTEEVMVWDHVVIYQCRSNSRPCEACNKKMNEGEEIYIYRDESTFCSQECLGTRVLADEITKVVEPSNGATAISDGYSGSYASSTVVNEASLEEEVLVEEEGYANSYYSPSSESLSCSCSDCCLTEGIENGTESS